MIGLTRRRYSELKIKMFIIFVFIIPKAYCSGKYSVIYKELDFIDDCTEFILSVSLNFVFPETLNLFISLLYH